MYKKVPNDLNFVAREKEVKSFWKEKHIFEKSLKLRNHGKKFIFYDGPPTANGKPHIGHVLTRVIKDIIPRYRTMKGFNVPRKAGWDTHGLPVELEVEKLLHLDGKEQIEDYGLAKFIKQCRESVWQYKSMWEDFSDMVGFWADMKHPYITYENNFIESEWWALKEIWKKGLLYKGYKIVPYCPRCGTPLSSHEVAQGYKDIKERSALIKFKVKSEDAYFLIWTTTPWTLPSNVALCVNPHENYVKVFYQNMNLYMAEALVPTVLKGEYKILESYNGKALEFKEYEPLYNFVETKEKSHYIVCADYVTLTDGTGIVHIAQAFGEDDAKVGRQYGLPFVQLVNEKGEMTAETKWPNMFVKDADREILKDLKDRDLLFAAPIFQHNYPHCWRCGSPLLYMAHDSWFVRMTAVKENLIRNNNTVNWIPENVGKGRFGDWLENVQDWSISRNRYWGTPLNIWECECGHHHAVGSISELKELSNNFPNNIELHRPFVDNIWIPCTKCGQDMKRVPEVIDCWFDSGAMPFAQHHYPFENKELFEEQFPADFISEAVDQTRGWFYSLMAISTLLFNKAPYKNVLILGHIQDENGQKMSKSKGNAVDPFEALAKFGADAIRWYFCSNSAPWLPNRFHDKIVIEGQRKFLSTLWNTYAFYVLYANIDKFDASKYSMNLKSLTVMDKWLLSKLNTLITEIDKNLENYRIQEAVKGLEEFVDELSNWYVRRNRKRFWASKLTPDKINAYMTLYIALVTVAKLSAPIISFMAEEIYQNLVKNIDKNAPESIHLCEYPVANERLSDKALETNMMVVLEIVKLGRSIRNETNRKNRQPLRQLLFKANLPLNSYYKKIIKEELNVKQVNETEDISRFVSYSFKPKLQIVGPKYGKQLGLICSFLSSINGKQAKQELDQTGKIRVEGIEIDLLEEDLLVETIASERYSSATANQVSVVLDIMLDDELIKEGIVRELISKIQTMRKYADFEVMDQIFVNITCDSRVKVIIVENQNEISRDVLAKEIRFDITDSGKFIKEWNINGEKVTICVSKV